MPPDFVFVVQNAEQILPIVVLAKAVILNRPPE
jgi:hypothetical protein